MTPSNKSNNKTGCSPVSSNCIQWEGGDLESIEVCPGDSVTDITQKLDKAVKHLQDLLDLSDFDLGCLVDTCASCPEPIKTLRSVLSLSRDKMCKVTNVTSSPVSQGEKELVIASCFAQTNSEGEPLSKLPHSDYTRQIASKVCNLLEQYASLNVRVNDLENSLDDVLSKLQRLSSVPQVTPVYVLPPNIKVGVDKAWEALEKRFESLETLTGLPGDLALGVGRQPTSLDSQNTLSGNFTYSSLPGWIVAANDKSGTAAAAINNMWLTINDLLGAIKTIQDNCCKVNCDSIVIDFDIRLSDDRLTATLFFGSKTKIPNGFTECNALGTKINIMDSEGHSHDKYVQIRQTVGAHPGMSDDGSWGSVEIDLTATSLNPGLDYTFTMDACMTNGSMTCQKCVTKTATYKDTCAFCEFTAVGAGSADGTVVIVYQELDSTTRKSIVLRAGEKRILRKKIKIISVSKDGNINVTTDCPSLAEALNNSETMPCYKIDFALDTRMGLAGGWDIEEARFAGIGFLDQKFPTEILAEDLDGIMKFMKQIPSTPFMYTGTYQHAVGNRNEKRIIFKAPASIGNSVYAMFKTPGYGDIRVFAVACNEANNCCPSTNINPAA